MPTKYVRCSISMTNGPIRFIFYSLVVLMSTSKPQNMKLKLPLVFELWDGILEITRHSTARQTAMNKLFFQNPCLVGRPQLPANWPTSRTLRIPSDFWQSLGLSISVLFRYIECTILYILRPAWKSQCTIFRKLYREDIELITLGRELVQKKRNFARTFSRCIQ